MRKALFITRNKYKKKHKQVVENKDFVGALEICILKYKNIVYRGHEEFEYQCPFCPIFENLFDIYDTRHGFIEYCIKMRGFKRCPVIKPCKVYASECEDKDRKILKMLKLPELKKICKKYNEHFQKN